MSGPIPVTRKVLLQKQPDGQFCVTDIFEIELEACEAQRRLNYWSHYPATHEIYVRGYRFPDGDVVWLQPSNKIRSDHISPIQRARS